MDNQKVRTKKLLVSLVGVGVLMLAVFIFDSLGMMDNYIRGIFIQSCFAIIMVTSLNLVMGYLGQIALGPAGCMAVGAYTSAPKPSALPSRRKPWRPSRRCCNFSSASYAAH